MQSSWFCRSFSWPVRGSFSIERRSRSRLGRRRLSRAQEIDAENGYTRAIEGFSHVADLDLLLRAAAEKKLFIDIAALPGFPEKEIWLDNPKCDFGTYENRFKIQVGKFTLDGSPQGKTAFITVP